MITPKQAEECLKNEALSKCLQRVEKELENSKCLPPDEIAPDGYVNPRKLMMSSIGRELECLYDAAQKLAKIDFEALG